MTFMPAYLRGLGLSGREISTVFALAPLLSLAVPLAWAYLADRTHRHDRVLRIVIGGAWLGFTPMLFARQLHRHPRQLGAVRAVRGRGRRPGRRLRGGARARGGRLRALAPVGLRRLRRRGGRGRRAAVPARPGRGSAGAGRDVADARVRVLRGDSPARRGRSRRAPAPRRRARAAARSAAAPAAGDRGDALDLPDALQRVLRRVPARPRPRRRCRGASRTRPAS